METALAGRVFHRVPRAPIGRRCSPVCRRGAYVTAGTQLAVAYDFSTIYVTARVDETDIDDVHPGQLVDIEVDAFPGADLTGTVREVQGGAAGVFSILPESNTSGNFQKVTQVIPVEITIDQPGDLALVPGMNVTVKIHR